MKPSQCLLLLAASLCTACGAVEMSLGDAEVVIAPDAPSTVRFAADEMTNVLGQAFGGAVPCVGSPTPGKVHIILGTNEWTRAAGIDGDALKRDEFVVAAAGDSVCIAGRDDPDVNFYQSIYARHTGVWSLLNEHATLFGVYEFLERFADVRFYFAGELGTLIPRRSRLVVPDGRFSSAPDFIQRNYSWYTDGVYYAGENREVQLLPARKLNYMRNRMQTQYIPCCHGSSGFRIQRRFSAEHPEYMALFKKGGKLVRDLDPMEKSHHPGQLCHSSAVYDEFFKDICSYARGEGPEVRGMGAWKNDGRKQQDWAIATFRRPYVDIMPQDGFVPCQCDACRAAYKTNEFHYATELVWGRTVELANRVKEAGLGIRITQMSYTPYARVPDFDIPDNVDVMVALGGPWGMNDEDRISREMTRIQDWRRKLGRPVWIWTYPGKYGQMDLPNIPCVTPRAWGKYYKRAAPWVFGAYAESGCDRALYQSLCSYVFGKVCWNTSVDVDAILDEYFRRMFGPAAADMAAIVDEMESRWLRDVSGRSIETPLGPQRLAPSPYDLCMRIYSRETLKKWEARLKAAASKVPPGSPEARRIALYRSECLMPLARYVAKYMKDISVEREVANRAAHPERKNLLVNGDFSQTVKSRSDRHFGIWDPKASSSWRGGWIAGEGDGPRLSLVDTVPPGVKGKALKIVGNGKTTGVVNTFVAENGRMRPGAKYRVSFFVRLSNVVPKGRDGGVCVRVWCDHNTFFPRNHLTGTTDWMHQSFTFVAGPNSDKHNSQYQIYLWDATGTVEFADLRLEELDAAQ